MTHYERARATGGIIALLPFLVEGALSLSIFRSLREKGIDVSVAYCADGGGGYTPDDMADFAAENLLINLSTVPTDSWTDLLGKEIWERGISLVLQVGAFALYPILPYIKERIPHLQLVDILYNEVGHTVNHFLYEQCFDGVIVESHHMARFVRECSLKPNPKVLIVESGVDLDSFSDKGRQRPGDKPLRIGYIGRFSPEKNPLGFIDLFERLEEHMPRLTGLIAGEGPLFEEISTRLRGSSASNRLENLGRVPNVSEALRSIDVLVVPSRLDGRPNVVMEANACGVPVIGAPVGGIPELIEEGVNGYLADPLETERICRWLSTWNQHPELLSAISSSSRKHAEARFDRRQMIANYAAAFAQLIG